MEAGREGRELSPEVRSLTSDTVRSRDRYYLVDGLTNRHLQRMLVF